MSAKLILDQSLAELNIAGACAVHISNITVDKDPKIASLLSEQLSNLKSNPEYIDDKILLGFREQLDYLGYPSTTSSVEKLIENFSKRGARSINNIVDVCNLISLKYKVSIAAHIHSPDQNIVVQRNDKCRGIRPMFTKKNKTIPKGDIIYTQNDQLLASIGKIDADNHDFRITDDTKDIVMIIIGNSNTTLEYNQQALAYGIDLLSLQQNKIKAEFFNSEYSTNTI